MARTGWLLKVVEQTLEKNNQTPPSELSSDLDQAWDKVSDLLGFQTTELAKVVAQHFGLEVCDDTTLDENVARFVPQRLAREKLIAPVSFNSHELVLATANPADDEIIKQVRFTSGKAVKLVIADPLTINFLLSKLYASEVALNLSAHIRLKADGEPASDSELQRNPIIILARKLLFKAVTEKASDIHIQPHLEGAQIRFRQDGILQQIATLPLDVMERIVRYFMAMSGMDSTQLFLPQDGSATLYVGARRIDLRISILPNRGGERLVVRLLDQSRTFGSNNLEFSPKDLQLISQLSSHNSGMILFAGPTGSGKTTSLYSLLLDLNNDEVNIITVENPVEYQLPGLSQVDINPERGLTFQNALRAILRQDPDILLVGEIRDSETAEIATRAALTGHLLFSTLHTVDAPNAIPRLLDLGVSQAVLGETLLGVVSQRLVRKLCTACATEVVEPYSIAETQFIEVNDSPPKLRAAGCKECNFSGYKGRIPIMEILEMNHSLREALLDNALNLNKLTEELSPSYQKLSLGARDQIYSGLTSAEEIQRVLGYRFWVDMAEANGRQLNFTTSQFGQSSGAKAKRGKILLIQPSTVEPLGALQQLEENLYEVLQVNDLHEAHEIILVNKDIQVMILDIADNKKTPLGLLNEFRVELAWAGLPCIFLLPENDNDIHQVLHNHFMDDYIKKPFDDSELLELIKGVISR